MKRSVIMKWVVGAILVAAAATVLLASSGCEVTEEVIVNPQGVPIERIVIEGPGGDLVPVGHTVVERLAPLLPAPWNTILSALAGAFTVVCGGWVWRDSRKKKDGK